jgi:hypothetical protein
MTDDLVKRLRDRDTYAKSNGWDNVVFGQAADRIEELEKALRLIADTDPAGDQHWPGRIARFVLDGGAND